MIFFDEVQHKIQNTAFFSNMGKADLQADNVILFSDLEHLLLSELNFIWLPTSPTQDDPFYTKQTLPKALIAQRIKITRCVMDSVKNIPRAPFQYDAHDFNIAAKNAISYAFRQYLSEKYFSLGDKWENIVNIYYQGYWPVGIYHNKIITL